MKLTIVVLVAATALLSCAAIDRSYPAGETPTAITYRGSMNEAPTILFEPSFTSPGAVQDLAVSQNSENLTLTWNPPADDGGSPITGYNIYRGVPPRESILNGSVDGTVFTFNSTGCSDNTTYSFHVAARNEAGEGDLGGEVNITYYEPPGAPVGVHIDYLEFNVLDHGRAVDHVTLSWTAPVNSNWSVSRYDVYRMAALELSTWSWCGSTIEPKFDDLISYPLGTYYYKVSACVMDQVSGPFSDIVTYDYGLPTEPLNVTARISGIGSLNVTWKEPLSIGATGVYYSINMVPLDEFGQEEGSAPFIVSPPYLTNQMFYEIVGLENGKRYNLTVSATNAIGEGPAAATITARTAIEPIGPALNYVKIDGWGNLTFEWDPPQTDAEYPLLNYSLYRGITEDELIHIGYLPPDLTKYTDRGLLDDTTYYYRIAGNNQVGEGHGVRFHMTTDGSPSSPRNLTAIGGVKKVSLNWEVPEHIGGGFNLEILRCYELANGMVVRQPIALIPNGQNFTSYVDNSPDLPTGTSWFYILIASNEWGHAESAPSYVTPLPYYGLDGGPTEHDASDLTLPVVTFGFIALIVVFFILIGTRKGRGN